jgi:hypothetical protein
MKFGKVSSFYHHLEGHFDYSDNSLYFFDCTLESPPGVSSQWKYLLPTPRPKNENDKNANDYVFFQLIFVKSPFCLGI